VKRLLVGTRIRVRDRRSSLFQQTGKVIETRFSDDGAVIEMDGDLPADLRLRPIEHPEARRIVLYPSQCGPVRQEGAR